MSQIATSIRSFVVLGCLVALPLAALWSGDLPETLSKLVSQARSFLEESVEQSSQSANALAPPAEAGFSAPDVTLPPVPSARPDDDSAPPAERTVSESAPSPVDHLAAAAALVAETPADPPEQTTSLDVQPPRASTTGEPGSVGALAAQAAGLRELGASYYALEEWGVDSALYRFHCKMAMREDANICRHFEAVDASASVAVDRVLNQVQAWRASLH